jgi:hypothetical protein
MGRTLLAGYTPDGKELVQARRTAFIREIRMLRRTFAPQLEALEDRWIPATIRLVGGSVFISNQVGTLTITPQTGTSVQISDGATVKVVAGSNVFVTGTNLANTVEVDLATSSYNGNMSFAMGNGDDVVNINGANAILGNVMVQSGLGNDSINLGQDGASNFGGNISLIDQRGNDDVNFSTGGGTSKFLGSISTIGFNFVNFFDSTVGGRVTSSVGQDTALTFFSWLGGPVNFNAGINITGGAGNDDIELDDAIIAGNANVNVGTGDNLLFFAPTQTNGNFTWTSGGGDDVIIFNPAGSTIGGNATFDLGDGDNSLVAFDANVTIDGNLIVRAGNGNNDIGGGFAGIVAGDVTFNLGSGDNTLDFAAGSIGGSLNLFLGNGNNEVNVIDTVLSGTLRVRTGNGNNSVAVIPAAASFVNADIRFGNGNDTFTLNANVTLSGLVNGGNGADTFVQGGATLTPMLVLASFEA